MHTRVIRFLPGVLAVFTLTTSAQTIQRSLTKVAGSPPDPTEQLFLILPTAANENGGLLAEPGRVFLSAPAVQDVTVFLTAEPPLEVPPSVVVQAGRLSQTFGLRVGDDSVATDGSWDVRVRAELTNGTIAESAIHLTDDEDAGFSVKLPDLMVEGIAGTGTVVLNAPRAADLIFTLTADQWEIQIPSTVTVPAGQTEAGFPILSPDNDQVDVGMTAKICADGPGQRRVCGMVRVVDDDVSLSQLEISLDREAVFSGQPLAVDGNLVGVGGSTQRTNVAGQLGLLATASVATFASEVNPIQFTNGIWSDEVVLQGEGLGLQIKVSAAGFETNSRPFDLLQGRDVPFDLSDAAWHGASGMFLVAEPAGSNSPPRLTEIDPSTGLRGRSLDLPSPVRRIALSDDGQVAWLASTQNTLQRIDLGAWRVDQEFLLSPGSATSEARDLVVLPGEPERVVALVNLDNTGWQVMLFDHGVASTNAVTLPGDLTYLSICVRPDASEVFCQWNGTVGRFFISSSGVTLEQSTDVTWSTAQAPNLVVSHGLLFVGSGEVFVADTLEAVAPFAVPQMVGLPIPEQNVVLFVQSPTTLNAYDLTTREWRGSQHLIGVAATVPQAPLRLLRWGERGLAAFTAPGANIVFFQSPLLTTSLPDLELTLISPVNGIYPDVPSPLWEFGVTNHGEGVAHSAVLRLDSGEEVLLGALAPGEGLVVPIWPSIGNLIVHAQASVTCAPPDSHPEDNMVTAVSRLRMPAPASVKQLVYGMNHLIVSPAGDRLYAAVARSAGDIMDGVAVIDPEAGIVEQMLPAGPDPQRLAVSDDGSHLFVLLGTNVLERWDLSSGSREQSWSIEDEAVLDLVVLPGTTDSLAVATTAGLVILDDMQPRTNRFSGSADARRLAFVNGTLWLLDPAIMRSFTIDDGGLNENSATPTRVVLPGGFASDGRYFYFSTGDIFDTETLTSSRQFLGNEFCADAAKDSLYTIVDMEVRRYALSSRQLQAKQVLFYAEGSPLRDIVRWGEDGLAMRSGNAQLLMLRSPLVPADANCDLRVSIAPPVRPGPDSTQQWSVMITNQSGVTAPRTTLTILPSQLANFGADVQAGVSLYQSSGALVAELGELPGHTSATVVLRGYVGGSQVTVSANVVSASVDPNAIDNSASVTVQPQYPSADVSIGLFACPGSVVVGEEFEAVFAVSNAGPETVEEALVILDGFSGLESLGTGSGGFPVDEFGNVRLGRLGAGESKLVGRRLRATEAGLIPVKAIAGGGRADPVYDNDHVGTVISAGPLEEGFATFPHFPGASVLAWDRSRRQILAAFPDDARSLYVLNPATLERVLEVPLGGLPNHIAPCLDGQHAWVSLGGEVVRVDLETGTVDRRFSAGGSVWAMAAAPDQPDVLLVAIDPDFTGMYQLVAFENGVKRGAAGMDFSWAGGGVSMLFTPEGRLFVAASKYLREWAYSATGLSEVATLDEASVYSGIVLSYASQRLFLGQGVVDVETGLAIDDPLASVWLVADPETGLAYNSSGARDAVTLAPRWRSPVPLPATDAQGIFPMGTNGFLLLGDSVGLVKPEFLGPVAVDLAVTLSVPQSVDSQDVVFPVQVSVTNRSAWVARQAHLALDLGSGLVFDGAQVGAEDPWILDLGTLAGATNFSFQVRATRSGTVRHQRLCHEYAGRAESGE